MIDFRPRGEKHCWWNGGVTWRNGCKYVKFPGHPRCIQGDYVKESVLIAERALGHYLPKKAVIHHFDSNPTNNSNSNLVICQDVTYHKLLHMRQLAFVTTGDKNKRKCHICKCWDKQSNLKHYGTGFSHAACKANYLREWRHNRHE